MPKVLIAAGAPGNHGRHFNWCDAGEVVGIHGMVCCTGSCGCDRSFTGTSTAKATTLGRIVEIDEDEYERHIATLDATIRRGWGSMPDLVEDLVQSAQADFDDLSDALAPFPAGVEVTVNKDRDGNFMLARTLSPELESSTGTSD